MMRSICRSNLFRLAVLLWFAGWLLVVMPGHTRGVVRLAGSGTQAEQSSCCAPQPTCCSMPTSKAEQNCCDGDESLPPEDPARHCAICFLKANLTSAPPVVIYTCYLGELEELAFLPHLSVFDEQSKPMHTRGRAPPA